MKTIGLIGGTSWHSTIDYYRYINEAINKRLGGNSSAKILLCSVNFEEVATLTAKQDWEAVGNILADAAKRLELAGADCILLCANTMHINADKVTAAIGIPLLHIADATLREIEDKKLKSVLLLGTRYTMQGSFYSARLEKAGIRLVLPAETEMQMINDSIYNEFSRGVFHPGTKRQYIGIIHDSISNGAEGVIFGCTEIPMLLNQEDSSLPVFDTTRLHAKAAVDFALAAT